MRHLDTLWQVVNAASTVRDLTVTAQTYRFPVTHPITFFLQSENVSVRVTRWSQPLIEVTIRLQAAFGWRVATDQDDAGVYIVAKRRAVVGSIASGSFDISVPQDTYLTIKLENGSLQLDNLNGTLNIPPM
ncbi:MAG: hypothetical protein U0694_23325 [Anaerolineae bacterium]